MLRTIIICPDAELTAHLSSALVATNEVTIEGTLSVYPNATTLMRDLRAHAPSVVFLSFEAVEKAREVVRLLQAEAEGVQTIAIHRQIDETHLREAMRAGAREFLAEPFARRSLLESLATVKALIELKPPVFNSTRNIFTFLPSKAGVGTSTIALNVSAAMSRLPDTRVLLSDFDLNSGMLRFMLKLEGDHCVVNALEHARELDESLWPNLVTSFDRLDILHAGRCNPHFRAEAEQVRDLVDFMRRNYDVVCFDVSGNLERYSLGVMQESSQIFMVCTPEVASLHLAKEKAQVLRSFDLDSRVAIVLNRCHKKAVLTEDQVAELLEAPVIATFPNDYVRVTHAMTAGAPIASGSELFKAFAEFAQKNQRPLCPPTTEPNKKSLGFFAAAQRALSQPRNGGRSAQPSTSN